MLTGLLCRRLHASRALGALPGLIWLHFQRAEHLFAHTQTTLVPSSDLARSLRGSGVFLPSQEVNMTFSVAFPRCKITCSHIPTLLVTDSPICGKLIKDPGITQGRLMLLFHMSVQWLGNLPICDQTRVYECFCKYCHHYFSLLLECCYWTTTIAACPMLCMSLGPLN